MNKIAIISLIVYTLPILPLPMPEHDPQGSKQTIETRASADQITTESLTVAEVPVKGGDSTSNAAGAAGSSGSGVSVAAAEPAPASSPRMCIGSNKAAQPGGKTGQLCRLRPKESPADAPGAPGPAPITLTSHDVATLIVDGSGITLQPPGATVLLHMPLIAYTNPTTRTLITSVGGTSVDVEVTPATYTWNWGDNTTTTTTDPGQPYPNQTVTHLYAATADNVVVTLTTTWTARFKPAGATDWQPVDGYVTTTQTALPFNIRRLIPYLSDDAEEHQGH